MLQKHSLFMITSKNDQVRSHKEMLLERCKEQGAGRPETGNLRTEIESCRLTVIWRKWEDDELKAENEKMRYAKLSIAISKNCTAILTDKQGTTINFAECLNKC